MTMLTQRYTSALLNHQHLLTNNDNMASEQQIRGKRTNNSHPKLGPRAFYLQKSPLSSIGTESSIFAVWLPVVILD